MFSKEAIIVSPQSWKKHFPDLESADIIALRAEKKKIKEEHKAWKENWGKKSKKNKEYKEKDKEFKGKIRKIDYLITKEAKKVSREVATKLLPSLSDSFKKVGDHGKSDACLIALFAKDNINELVQTK